jgi:broad specificity phosphatase PhoE
VTRLILCRHGDTDTLAEALRSVPLTAVYTSPLPRAAEPATAIARAQGLEPTTIDDLREIDFGEAEGRAFDDLPAALQEGLLQQPTRVRFPGGETYGELRERVCAALDEIVALHPEGTVAVVTHAGPIRAALASWLSIGEEGVFRIEQREAAVNVVDWNDAIPLVRLVNGKTIG